MSCPPECRRPSWNVFLIQRRRPVAPPLFHYESKAATVECPTFYPGCFFNFLFFFWMCCEISDVLLPVECRMATGSSSWTSFTTEALFICEKYQLSGCLPLLYTCRLACWPSCSSPSQAWCPSTTYGGTNGTSSSSRCRSEHVHSLGKTSVMHRLRDFMLRIVP